MNRLLTRWGLDEKRLVFALRTAMASSVALFVAYLIGLEHPSWAAMSVWAASQPGRGMLLEKSLYRMAGSVVGVLFGLVLVWGCGDNGYALLLGLSLWLGLCTGAGNIIHGLTSYLTLLSGYSASLVVLLSAASNQTIVALGADRLLTVLVGVVTALITGLLFTPRDEHDALVWRLRQLTISVIEAVYHRSLGKTAKQPFEQLLLEAAQLEEALEPFAAGSLRSRHAVRTIRAMLFAHVSILKQLALANTPATNLAFSEHLGRAIQAHENPSPIPSVLQHLKNAADTCNEPLLQQGLYELVQAFTQRQAFHQNDRETLRCGGGRLLLHRDWTSAGQAMLRTSTLTLLAGAAWAVTSSPIAAYVLLGTTVMVTLFSTFDNPAMVMKPIITWQMVAVAANALCQLLLWPLVDQHWQMYALMLPFTTLVAFPMAHRRLMAGSLDYVMILLLLSQPHKAVNADPLQVLSMGLAVVAGPVLALLAFKLIYPTSLQRRQQLLKRAMWQSLSALSSDMVSYRYWQARAKHRVLKLVGTSRKTRLDWAEYARASIDVMLLGECIESWQSGVKDLPEPCQRRHRVWLRRMHKALQESPQATVALLQRYAAQEQQRLPYHSAQALQVANAVNANQRLWQ